MSEDFSFLGNKTLIRIMLYNLLLNAIKYNIESGKIVLKSTFSGKTNLEMWRVVVNEITIVGSRCGRFQPALDLLQSKSVDVESLISEELSLYDGVKAMHKAEQKGVMKVILSIRN